MKPALVAVSCRYQAVGVIEILVLASSCTIEAILAQRLQVVVLQFRTVYITVGFTVHASDSALQIAYRYLCLLFHLGCYPTAALRLRLRRWNSKANHVQQGKPGLTGEVKGHREMLGGAGGAAGRCWRPSSADKS